MALHVGAMQESLVLCPRGTRIVQRSLSDEAVDHDDRKFYSFHNTWKHVRHVHFV